MKVVNKIELKIENADKCSVILDSDCPLGQLYDFSCALQHFALQKMKEYEKKPEEEAPKE